MSNLKKALEVMKRHAELDLLVQGGWIDTSEKVDGLFKGCFFGCAMQTDVNAIEKFCEEYRMPLWVGYLAEAIFEGLEENDAMLWPVKLLEVMAVLPEDFDYEAVRHELAIIRLTKLFNENDGDVKAAIKGVIECHKDPENANFESARSAAWSAARSAARSAESAWSAEESARSAARSAAWSAARSAESAWSAEESAWSAARSAARSAAWSAESANLIKVLACTR